MNRSIEKVFLPKGLWYDFTTGKKFVGNKRYTLFFKDEDYPVYAKAGSIIPIAKLDENINNTNPPKGMEINIFPGSSNVYRLYEDDGLSSLYEEGYYIITAIDFNYAKDNYNLSIHPVEGKTGIIPDTRDYFIRFRNTREPENISVSINNQEFSKFNSYIDENDFIIEINDVDTKSELNVSCSGNNIEIDAARIINEDINEIISDLQIETLIKERVGAIIFSNMKQSKKRIAIRKLKNAGLDPIFIKLFLKLLEYVE